MDGIDGAKPFSVCVEGILVVVLQVDDCRRGAAAVRAEIESLGLLSKAQISWSEGGAWQAVYPADKPAFDPMVSLAAMRNYLRDVLDASGEGTK
jgi:hypothetical protein